MPGLMKWCMPHPDHGTFRVLMWRAIHTLSLPSASTPYHKSMIAKEIRHENGHGNEIKQKFCLIFMFDYLFVIFGHKLHTSLKKINTVLFT